MDIIRISMIVLVLCALGLDVSVNAVKSAKHTKLDRLLRTISESDIKSAVSNESTCPHWTFHKYHNSSCVCGSSSHNTIRCTDDKSPAGVLSCHCMSRSESNKSDGVVEGNCPYLCTNDFYRLQLFHG